MENKTFVVDIKSKKNIKEALIETSKFLYVSDIIEKIAIILVLLLCIIIPVYYGIYKEVLLLSVKGQENSYFLMCKLVFLIGFCGFLLIGAFHLYRINIQKCMIRKQEKEVLEIKNNQLVFSYYPGHPMPRRSREYFIADMDTFSEFTYNPTTRLIIFSARMASGISCTPGPDWNNPHKLYDRKQIYDCFSPSLRDTLVKMGKKEILQGEEDE